MKKLVLLIGSLSALAMLYHYLAQRPGDTNSSILIDAGATLNNFMRGENMRMSAIGRDALARREGIRYTVYSDTGGILTAGIGHALRKIDGVFNIGDSVTLSQVATWFENDLAHAENIVAHYVNVPLSQNQFDALCSMSFNLGSAVFRNADGTDTGLLRALNRGDYTGTANEILRWNRDNGDIVAGLVNRRASEQQQFLA